MVAMDTYQKMETVQAEQWNRLGDVKEAGVQKYKGTNEGWIRASVLVGGRRQDGGHRVRPGDYIVKAYDIRTDGTVYYPVSKEDFENLWSKVSKPEWEGDGDAPAGAV